MEPRERLDLQDELARMRGEIEKLQTEKLLQGDEIRALKAEARSYQEQLRSLNDKSHSQEEQSLHEGPARIIGEEVRLRFLEQHRLRLWKEKVKGWWNDKENDIFERARRRIKCGDRAAHRGRPVVDALLCLTGSFKGPEVFLDLYGVNPDIVRQCKDIPEIIEITGYHASPQSEGGLTSEFQVPFKRLLEVAKTYSSPKDLKAGFGENKTLQQLHIRLETCYDKIFATNSRGRQGSSSQYCP